MIRVSVQQMEADRGRLSDLTDQIPGKVKELREAMLQLGGCWEGPAWQTFQKQLADDLENMLLVKEDMDRYLSMMENAGKKYTKTEQNTYRAISSVRI